MHLVIDVLLIGCYGWLSTSAFSVVLPTTASRTLPKIRLVTSTTLSVKKESWSPADDWEKLSSENSLTDASSIYNIDQASKAAYELSDSSYYGDGNGSYASEEDDFLNEMVDSIHSPLVDPDGPLLYDTKESFDSYTQSVSFHDEMGKEISLLVRCNESPNDLLVSEGRMLPELKDEDKYNVNQLLVEIPSELQSTYGETITKKKHQKYKPTEFFSNAVGQIFRIHAKPAPTTTNGDGDDHAHALILDAGGIASWMSQSLGEHVGKHDKRVNIVTSKYSSHGSGVLTEGQFMQLYIDASCTLQSKPSSDKFVRARKPKVEQPTIMSVWRDLQNHGFLPPIVLERARMQQKIDKTYGTRRQLSMDMVDECEILEWDNGQHSTPRASSTSQMEGATSQMNIQKSSHELVQLASDGVTPSRLRDGDFVFIDEESCIGCKQCCNVAPSAFKMLESGRARTYHQTNLPEASTAVSICPVDCMHNVSFDELREMETARDVKSDKLGRGHMGSSHAHIPLNVARSDSDVNRRSSWYHTLKHKCYTSKNCPQRGCYDCPMYNQPGANPYFQAKHRKAERVRAQDIMASGEADEYRTTFDL